MAQAFGLYTHQRNNRIRSNLLIAGLFLLVYLTTWGLLLIAYGYGGVPRGHSAFGEANRIFRSWFPFITLATILWVFIGFRLNVAMIGAVTGARGITQAENPKLYRMLENLCISRGLPMPKLAIMQSDALNAFASGVNDSQFTVTVTTGLLDQLNDQEVEAVLAHELTHIRNGDVRLMVIAVVVAGVISFAGELVFRGVGRSRIRMSSDDTKKGNGLAVIVGIDKSLFEAAEIDGASIFQRIRAITLPLMIPTVMILLLLSIGNIFRGNFDLFYQIVGNNGLLFDATDVIDTYVFRSLIHSQDIGMSAAAGLYQSVLCFAIIMTSNFIVKRIQPDYSLF